MSRADHYQRALRSISTAGLALGGIAIFYFVAGSLGLAANPIICLFMAGLSASIAAGIFAVFVLGVKPLSLTEKTILAVAALLAAVLAVLCLTPPIARAELIHHLAIPRLYAKAGAIIEVPFARYSYYPMLLDMLYTPWVVWGLDSVPKLLHLFFCIMTAMLVYGFVSDRAGKALGLLGALIFLSTPIVMRLCTTAYVDLSLAFYSFAALLCCIEWFSTGKRSWIILSGLLAGAAAACKPNGALAIGLLFLVLLVLASRSRKEHPLPVPSLLFLFGAGCAVWALPWAIRNFFWTGNPIYPFFRGLFGPSLPPQPEPVVAIGALAKRLLLYGEEIWQVLLLPVRVFFTGEDDNPRLFDGRLTPLLILFVPFAFKSERRVERLIFLAFALTYIMLAVLLTDMRARYLIPAVAPLAALSALGLYALAESGRWKIPACALSAVFFVMNATYLKSYAEKIRIVDYLSGESREDYLRKALPEYRAMEFLNANPPASGHDVYLVFAARKGYYLNTSYTHDDGELPQILMSAIESAAAPEDIGRALRKKNIALVLARRDLLDRHLRDNLPQDKLALWSSFISAAGTVVYVDDRFVVFGSAGVTL